MIGLSTEQVRRRWQQTRPGHCTYWVYSGERWDMAGHACDAKAKYKDSLGLDVCGRHTDEAVKKREAVRAEKLAGNLKSLREGFAKQRLDAYKAKTYDELMAVLENLPNSLTDVSEYQDWKVDVKGIIKRIRAEEPRE